ncbi:MAG: hypothetical protein AAB779_04100 [Patescibacteria group bacterium]
MGQKSVAEDERRVEGLDQEIAALWAEINAGSLERGEAQRLLGEVKDGQKQVEQVVHGFAEQIPEQIEAELLKAMAEDQEAQAGVSAGLAVPEITPAAGDPLVKGVVGQSAVGRARGRGLNTIPALEQLVANNETGLIVSGSLAEEPREELLRKNADKLKTAQNGQQIVDAEFTEITTPRAPEAGPVALSVAEVKLGQARKMLLETEKSDKSKTSIEYADALKEYQEARIEFVAGNVDRFNAERIKIAQERAESIVQEKKFLQKAYDSYKGLGEYNLAKLLNIDEHLDSQDDDNKLTRAGKATGRFLTRTISLRAGLNVALLGGGIAVASLGGVGVAAGGAILWGRRILGGAMGGAASYDALQHGREKLETGTLKVGIGKWKKEVGKENAQRRELTREEVSSLSYEDVKERLAHFEAAMNRDQKNIAKNETYDLLQERYAELSAGKNLDALMAEADAKLQALTKQSKTKDKILMAVGTTIGLTIASGVVFRGALAARDYFSGTGKALEHIEAGPKGLGATELPKAGIEAPKAPYVDVDNPAVGNVAEVKVTPPEGVLEVKAEVPVVEAAEHVEYQGGNSVWQEIENQYAKRFPEFHDLPKGEQTYLIDQVKDKIAVGPDKFGLADIDKVTADQLKAVDWDNAFADAKLESPNLSHEQIANIEGPKGHEPMAKAEISPAQSGEAGVVPESKSSFIPPEASAKTEIAVERPSIPVAEAEPDLKIEDKIYSQPKVDMKDIALPPEAGSAVSLEQAAAKEFWAPDKAKTFAYLNAEDIEILSKDPELVEARLAAFDSATKRTTELLAKGEINKLPFFEQGQPVLGADGKMYIIEQYGKGKDQWYAWQVKDDGELDQVVNNRKGWFGTKAVDLFKGKELHDALGYTEPKGKSI